MISFETPVYFGLLSLVPLGIYFLHFYRGRGGRIRFSFSKWRGESFSYPAYVLRAILFLTHLSFWAGVALLIVALAGPVKTVRETIYLSEGLRIIIVLDESPSMSAKDFQPENRFEAAKDVIVEFASSRPNDAIGLVSFSRDAALRVPPTLDTTTLIARLDDLRIMSLGDGTAIGMGLSVAAMHLERSRGSRDLSTIGGARSGERSGERSGARMGGVIVLITDGENNAGEILPETATDIASRLGIRVYAVGIGTSGEVPIEYTDPETGIVRTGMFESRFNEDLLKNIAESTGGQYYSAQSPGALNAVFRSIDALETTEKRVRIEVKSKSLYAPLLWIAGLLFLVNFVFRSIVLREVLA